MKCPFCKSDDTQVIDSRMSDDGESIRRRRRCAGCSKRFTTYETVEFRMPRVFNIALNKRPVSTALVDEAIATIRDEAVALGEREVPSRQIGEMVMRELHKLDQVAYIRFASVYRSFQGADDFRDAIREVQKSAGRK
jgi:transcriptional repressor NrdR